MTYVADINDVTTPTETDFVGEAAPVEIRAIKQRFISLLAELKDYVDAEMLDEIQRLNNLVTAANNAANTNISQLNTDITNHLAALGNPHNITKTSISLGNIENWPLTTAHEGTGDFYVTLQSLENLKVAITNSTVASVNASIQAVADRVTALEAKWNW